VAQSVVSPCTVPMCTLATAPGQPLSATSSTANTSTAPRDANDTRHEDYEFGGGITRRRAEEETCEEADTSCVCCFDARRTHAAVPCGHRSYCGACVQRAEDRAAVVLCPMCREPVREWLRVWG
jgi:hypothetical protein